MLLVFFNSSLKQYYCTLQFHWEQRSCRLLVLNSRKQTFNECSTCTKKRLRSKASKAFLRFRRRLNFPGSCPPSIFSAKELNYCVRYGNRCDLLAIVTEYISTFRQYIFLFSCQKPIKKKFQIKLTLIFLLLV